MTTDDLDELAQLDDLPQAEAKHLAAKTAYAAEQSSDNRTAFRAAQTTLREARWRDRGGLDNPHGAQSYADFLTAQREQRRTNRYVTLAYEGDTVTTIYGDWIVLVEPVAADNGEGEQ